MGFKKIEEMIYIYKETREKTDELFQSVYTEAVSLANVYSIEEKWSQSCGHYIDWNDFLQK